MDVEVGHDFFGATLTKLIYRFQIPFKFDTSKQILKLVSQYLSDATKSSMGPTCLVFSNSGHEFLPTASFLLRVTLALSSAPAMVTRWSTTEVAWSAEVPCCRCGRLVSNDWSWGQQK